MRAILRGTRITPKKANLIAGLIRNKKAVEALNLLKYSYKKAAQIIYKLLFSAVANAEKNFSQKKEELIVSKVLVNKGIVYKRGQSHARGRVTSLLKRTSHIIVELEAMNGQEELTKKK